MTAFFDYEPTRRAGVAGLRLALATIMFGLIVFSSHDTLMAQGCQGFQFTCNGTNCGGSIWFGTPNRWSWTQYYCLVNGEWILRETQNGCCFYA